MIITTIIIMTFWHWHLFIFILIPITFSSTCFIRRQYTLCDATSTAYVISHFSSSSPLQSPPSFVLIIFLSSARSHSFCLLFFIIFLFLEGGGCFALFFGKEVWKRSKVFPSLPAGDEPLVRRSVPVCCWLWRCLVIAVTEGSRRRF